MLRIEMVNLISYAFKFTPTCSNVEIDIGFQSQKAEAIVFIRDNGVGFDMTFADELFGVFQRLHRADQFKDTGFGLANVHRSIRRFDGKSWVEGKVDQGAIFFTILFHKPKGDMK